jgi:hypothetical protein
MAVDLINVFARSRHPYQEDEWPLLRLEYHNWRLRGAVVLSGFPGACGQPLPIPPMGSNIHDLARLELEFSTRVLGPWLSWEETWKRRPREFVV